VCVVARDLIETGVRTHAGYKGACSRSHRLLCGSSSRRTGRLLSVGVVVVGGGGRGGHWLFDVGGGAVRCGKLADRQAWLDGVSERVMQRHAQ